MCREQGQGLNLQLQVALKDRTTRGLKRGGQGVRSNNRTASEKPKEESEAWSTMSNTERGQVLRLETSPLICQFVVTGDFWQSQFERCWGGGGTELS